MTDRRTEDLETNARRGSRRSRSLAKAVGLLSLTTAFLLSLSISSAFASLQVIDYFGSEAGSGTLGGQFLGAQDVAVNYTGAGPADPGDVYVADSNTVPGGRIQRFAYDDNGTPAEPYDDSYHFVSAWGADVVQAGGVGDLGDANAANFEICSVASQCKAPPRVAGNGNGTIAGNGAMNSQGGIAVDQDTGRVYVSDGANFVYGSNAKVSVYEGDGTFLYSFGFDVDATEAGTGYEVCPATHVCKEGLQGSGVGQVNIGAGIAVSPPDGDPDTGTVFLADGGAHRITTYDLDGKNPASFGSAADFSSFGPTSVAVDSRGIVYVNRGASEATIVRYDSENANGGGIGFLAPIVSPPLPPVGVQDLEVDPDTDGAGPDEDVLYVLPISGNPNTVLQLGPVNDPGLSAPPLTADDQHGALVGFKFVGSLGLDPASGRLFVSAYSNNPAESAPLNSPPAKQGVYVLGPSGGAPSVSLDAITNVTATSAMIEGTVNPNSGPPVSYSLEYSRDGVDWSQTEKTLLGAQTTDQPVSVELDPLGTGLEPNALYHVRLVATKAFAAPVVSTEQTFTTDPQGPQAETTGSPLRTATTARLEGRLNPRNSATTYRFEYLDDAAYQANLTASEPPFTGAASTSPKSAGSGGLVQLVATDIQGLQPDTTYHYRLLANGSAVTGEEMTLTTRASDAPLDHGRLPGPAGSDRAYEQVSLDDSGGNPVGFVMGFSDEGRHALYSISGGTPISDTGSFGSVYYAEREPDGWQTKKITPPRAELLGGSLAVAGTSSDLSTVLIESREVGAAGSALWGLAPSGSPAKLFQTADSSQIYRIESGGLSADGSRATAVLEGSSLDPAYPSAGSQANLYDISASPPRLVSLLPGDVVADCGISAAGFEVRLARWLSDDGRYAFFPTAGDACASPLELYMRDLVAGESKLLSGPVLSGSTCGSAFLKQTPGAAFFWTQSRLAAEDAPQASCGGANGGDVYRYDISSEALDCLTCVVPGLNANVLGADSPPAFGRIAVADDGSRVYFTANSRLLPGVPAGGTYRLAVGSGELAYVGQGRVGSLFFNGNGLTPDGSVLIFRSADPSLNPLGDGTDNGGTNQYYRYDDRDRSLTCISCPQDGSAPFAGLASQALLSVGSSVGANTTPISDDGQVVAFAAPTSLVGADQNTPQPGPNAAGAATDVYEWRDGRLFLITDGLTNWAFESEPKVAGVSPSGKDIYFQVAAQYTQDALDGFMRLYDARIGGGFEFPPPPKPCPLEVCQGIPKGPPAEQEPSSATLNGAGNPGTKTTTRRCPKGKRRVRRAGKTRCLKPVSKKAKNRANHDRRASR